MTLRAAKFLRAAFAATLILAAGAPALAQGTPAFSPDQKTAIEGIVRDYLLKNPEILQEVFAELERRQLAAQKAAQENALAKSRDKLENSPHDFVLGNPKGDVVLVEFMDYNCGFCKRALNDVTALLKEDAKLKVVIKDFPVLGPGSVEASRIALAAKRQLTPEKAAEYHSRLMETRGQVNGERATALAKDMGLDVARLAKDAEDATVRNILAQNVELGDQLGLTGTPAFVVGDGVIFGAVGLDALRGAVANVRKCGKTDC